MNARRVAALVERVVAEIRRDHRSLALLFIAPILMTGLATFILREASAPSIDAVIVSNGAPAPVVNGLTTAIEAAGGFVAFTADDEAAARALIEDDRATLAIVLPADFATATSPRIAVITNGMDPSGEAAELGAIQKALGTPASTLAGGSLPTVEHLTVYGAASDDPMSDYAPAIVGFFAYFFVYLLTGVSFLRERTGGTLERLMATPVTRAEIVTGYTLGFGLFAVIQVAVLMAWVLGTVTVPAMGPIPSFALGLGVQVAGSPLIAYLVVVLLALGAVSLGIFCSTFARTELQVIQFIPLVLSPQFLLSGVIFPISSLPDVIRPVAPVLPLTYAVDGLREVFIRGADLSLRTLQVDLAVLAGVAVLFGGVAALTIRRDIV